MAENDDEAALELATNLAVKLLFEEKTFVTQLEENIARRLKEKTLQEMPSISKGLKPETSTSTPGIEDVQNAIRELYTTIKSVTKSFVLNADLKIGHNDPNYVNRDAGVIFETGMKVERICTLEADENGLEIGKQIGSASRRVIHALKLLSNKVSSGQSTHISSTYGMAARICDFCYTIAQQTERYGDELRGRSDRKKIKRIVETLLEEVNSFNVTVVEKLETALGELKSELRLKQKQKDYDRESNVKFSSSVQDAVRLIHAKESRRTHAPGSISSSVLSKNKGFLDQNSLAKARVRLAALKSKPKYSQPPPDPILPKECLSSDPNSDDSVFKSATVITREIMDEIRSAMNVENGEQLWLGIRN